MLRRAAAACAAAGAAWALRRESHPATAAESLSVRAAPSSKPLASSEPASAPPAASPPPADSSEGALDSAEKTVDAFVSAQHDYHSKTKQPLYVVPSSEYKLKIFAGHGNLNLAHEVAIQLGTQLGRCTVTKHADGETFVEIHDDVLGKDVFVIQSTCKPVHDNLMELLLMATALKRASAARVTAVIPYFGYSRQSTMAPGFFQPQPQSQPQTQPEGGKSGKLFKKPTSRASALLPADSGGAAGAGGPVLPATTIAAADIALLLQTAGVDQIVAVDVHVNSFGGFFRSRVPVQNLDALPAALPYFISRDLKDPVVVSSSESGVIRARKFAQYLQRSYGVTTPLALVYLPSRQKNTLETPDLTHHRAISPDIRMELVGDVRDRDVIIVDDMIDTASRMTNAARTLSERGARRIFGFATHGLFTGKARKLIEESALSEVVVFNTIPLLPENESPRIRQLSASALIAEAIRRVYNNESLSNLFHEDDRGP